MAQREKWEYKVVSLDQHQSGSTDAASAAASGFVNSLGPLGYDGWEAVGPVPISYWESGPKVTTQLLLKRRVFDPMA